MWGIEKMRRNLSKALTFLTVSALSITLLSGCDNSGTTESSSMTENVVSEDVVEENGSQQSITEEVNQESSQEVSSESTQESQEKPEESTEETSNQDGVQSLQDDSTQQEETWQSTEQAHTHTWVTETRYRTVHHDAVTHTEQVTIVDQAAWDETVTTYTTETQVIHHDAITHTVHHEGGWHGRCDDCGAEFDSWQAAEAHLEAADHNSYSGRSTDGWDEEVVDQPAWDETVEVQVPHTTTVHHDAVTHVETKTVIDKEAYDEQVPYTVTVCSECGKEK